MLDTNKLRAVWHKARTAEAAEYARAKREYEIAVGQNWLAMLDEIERLRKENAELKQQLSEAKQ